MTECAEWLMENDYSKAKKIETVRNCIRRQAIGERDSFCKMHFEFI